MRFESLHAFSDIQRRLYGYERSYYPNFAGLSDVVVTPDTLVACADETVTATCSVSDTTFLQWTPGDFFSESELEVFLLAPQDVDSGPVTLTSSSGVTFSAELTDSVMSESGGLFNLQSILTTTAPSLTNGTILQCRGESPQPHDSANILLMTGLLFTPSLIYDSIILCVLLLETACFLSCVQVLLLHHQV